MRLQIEKRVIGAILAIALVSAGSLLFVKDALAATGQLYVSPASASVQKGNNVSVNVRLNPGTGADTVTVTVGYDPSKLTYVSTDYAGSPYNQQVGATATANSVSFTATELSGTPITTDSLVAKLTFTANVDTGSSSLTLSGNAANAGVATDPSTTGATISFTGAPVTTPPATCPAGQIGTPPSCTTPPAAGSGNTGHASPGAPVKSIGSTTTTTSKPTGVPATVTSQKVLYTQTVLNFTTTVPTQAYVRFGLGDQLTSTTPVSAYATSHSITLDPSVLIPGQEYSYVVVSTDQQGTTSQSAVRHFTTKGLSVTVGVFDKNHKPLRGKTITLHSSPQTVKTDKNGFATFSDVAPGTHHVIYNAGKQTYDEQVAVVNNVQTSGDTQTAAAQNFSVVYGFVQTSLSIPVWVWLCIAVLVIIAVIALAQAGRLGVALQVRRNIGAPLISQPIVVGGNTAPSSRSDNSITSEDGKKIVQDRLNSIPNPMQPQPGSTVMPKSERSELTDHQNGPEV